jgi:putative ABC transport system ATP-binding protein
MHYLQITDLLPTYFDAARKSTSEIWGKDLRFEKGDFVKVVAPSGSGKTSLMHFLYGMRNDYNGTVSYGGASTKNFGAEDYARYRKDHLSIIFQDLRLFPDQNVFENIDIKRQLNPYHPPEKIREMAERLGIGTKLSSKCKTCSYGEQQRVAIIRALMQPFEFLLLDEPFSHLDNKNSEKAMELMIEEARKRNAAIIFADLERIEFFPYTRLYHL